jgi:cellulose synthase operon protein C
LRLSGNHAITYCGPAGGVVPLFGKRWYIEVGRRRRRLTPTQHAARPDNFAATNPPRRGMSRWFMNSDRIPLNLRLLSILLGSAFVLGVIVFVVHHFQERRLAGIFLEKARTAKEAIAESDDLDTRLAKTLNASNNYLNYLQSNLTDYDVMAEHGLMLAGLAEQLVRAGREQDATELYGRGQGALEQVLREQPNRSDLRRTLVRSLLGLGIADQAIDHIAILATVPTDADGLRKLFDRYDLWTQAASLVNAQKTTWHDDVVASFLLADGKSVDRAKLLTWLGDNLWMAIEDTELLTILAKCEIRMNQPKIAERPLEKAIGLVPSNSENYQMLADVLHQLGRDTDADYWMSELVVANPDSFEANRIRGEYRLTQLRRVGREQAVAVVGEALRDAIESIRKAIDQAIDKADAAAPTAQTTADLKAAMSDAMRAAPREGEPVSPRYRDGLLAATKQLVAVSRTLSATKPETDGVREALVLAARAELMAARLDANPAESPHMANARAYGTAAAELFPDDTPSYLLLAELERSLGRTQQAVDWLRRGKKAKGDRALVMWQLASLLINSGQLDEARDVINELNETGAPALFRTHLQGMMHYAEGEWAVAKEEFEQVLPYVGNLSEGALQVNLVLAACCEKLGLVDQQREALVRAASLDATSREALMKLAEIEMQSEQYEGAIADYRLVLQMPDPPFVARLALVQALLAENLNVPKSERNWAEIEQTITGADKAVPNSVHVAILRARLLAARDKPRDAESLLTETYNRVGREIDYLRAQRQSVLDEAEKLSGDAKNTKLNEAKQLDARIRQQTSLQPLVSQSLLEFAERAKNWENANQLIQSAEKQLGDSPQTRLMKARNLAVREGEKAAPAVRKLLEGSEAFPRADRAQFWNNLALVSYEIRDYKTAEELCDRVLKMEPNDLAAYRLQLQIAAAQNDTTAMESVLDQIKKIENKPSAFWYYGEALRLMLLADQGGSAELLKRALDCLARASQLRPRWGRVSLLTGMVLERLGRQDAAAEKYLEAIDRGVVETNIVRRTAQLLIRNQRLHEADRMFRLLAEREPLVVEQVGRELRMVKAGLGEFDAAIAPARKVAAASSKPEDHVWLGQLLSVVGRRLRGEKRKDEAEAMLREGEQELRQAVILKSDAPDPWMALIQFYAETDQTDKADKTIAQARLKLPPTATATALAQCYELLKRPQDAAEQYRIALANSPKDAAVAQLAATFYQGANKLEDAKSQLMRIIRGEVNATTQQKTAARRQMAMMLLSQGGTANRKEAQQWIEQNLAQDSKSQTDLFLKAVLLADDPSGRHQQEAIASLEGLLESQPGADSEIRYTLARLYFTDGNWRKFQQHMEELLRARRDVPRYLAAYATALIEHKDYPAAEAWVAELVKLAPDDATTITLRAEVAFQQGQYERTKKVLDDYLAAVPEGDSAQDDRLTIVASGLQGYADRLRALHQDSWAETFSKEAYQVFRRYVDRKPERDLLMATFLAKQGRLDEAIDLIDTLWETSEPMEVAKASFVVIDGTGVSGKQLERVDQILGKAAQQHPDDDVLQIAIAVIRSYQERPQDAEAIYRKILGKTPDNPTALNNLAVLLARQGVRLREAAALIDLAIRQAGPTGDLLDSRATVQLALGNPAAAVEDLRLAITEQPSALRFFHQAEALNALGQRRAAIESLHRATEMGLKAEHLQGAEQRSFKKLEALLK